MRLSVKYSSLVAVVVLGLGFWVMDVQAVDPVDIGSTPTTPSAPTQEAALTPGEQDEAKGTDCIPPKKEHRPLKDQSTKIQQEYRTAIKAALGEEVGETCFKVYMVEGENIEAQPLPEAPKEENETEAAKAVGPGGLVAPGETPMAPMVCAAGDAACEERKAAEENLQKTYGNPLNQDESVTCDSFGSCSVTKDGEQAQVYSDVGTGSEYQCSEVSCGFPSGTGNPDADSTIPSNNVFEEKNTTIPTKEWVPPVTGGMTKGNSADYGYRRRCNGGSCYDSKHYGQDWYPTDLTDPNQRNVAAMKDGEVAKINNDSKGYGKYVSVYHGKDETGKPVYTTYSHIEPDSNLKIGQQVTQGQTIGKVAGHGTAIGREISSVASSQGISYDNAYQQVMNKYSPDGTTWNSGKTAPHAHVEFNRTPSAGSSSAVNPHQYTDFERGQTYTQGSAAANDFPSGDSVTWNGGNISVSDSSNQSGAQSVSTQINQGMRDAATAFSRQTGISLPTNVVSGMSNTLGSLAGSLLGVTPSGSGGTPNAGAITGGISGALSNLVNTLNPFASKSNSGGTSNTDTVQYQNPSNTQQLLVNLLNTQQQELTQLLKTNPNVSQHQTLLEHHRHQLDQFSDLYPGAESNTIYEWQKMLQQHQQQLDQFQQQQQQTPAATQSSYNQQLQQLTKQQQSQQQQTLGSSLQTTTNTTVSSDLTIVALRADKTLDDEYRFRGSLSRDLTNANDHLAFSEIGSYFGSNVTHELLLDFGCDGTVDDGLIFVTPYYSILPRSDGADVLLSEYKKVLQDGLHCFAFDVDTANVIPETNEGNNLSSWREFIAGFGASTDSTTLPPLNFEVSAYTANYGTLTQNWTTSDVVISEGQELAFRWDAPQYESCVPLLSSLTPGMADNTSPVERNTLSESVNLHEHTGYYELRCTTGDDTRVEAVHVRVE